MTKEKKPQKEKEIVFSEETGNKINGFSLALTFIAVDTFLIYNSSYFGHEIISTILARIFIPVGCVGLLIELPKFGKQIKGVGSFVLGILFITIGIFYTSLYHYG